MGFSFCRTPLRILNNCRGRRRTRGGNRYLGALRKITVKAKILIEYPLSIVGTGVLDCPDMQTVIDMPPTCNLNHRRRCILYRYDIGRPVVAPTIKKMTDGCATVTDMTSGRRGRRPLRLVKSADGCIAVRPFTPYSSTASGPPSLTREG